MFGSRRGPTIQELRQLEEREGAILTGVLMKNLRDMSMMGPSHKPDSTYLLNTTNPLIDDISYLPLKTNLIDDLTSRGKGLDISTSGLPVPAAPGGKSPLDNQQKEDSPMNFLDKELLYSKMAKMYTVKPIPTEERMDEMTIRNLNSTGNYSVDYGEGSFHRGMGGKLPRMAATRANNDRSAVMQFISEFYQERRARRRSVRERTAPKQRRRSPVHGTTEVQKTLTREPENARNTGENSFRFLTDVANEDKNKKPTGPLPSQRNVIFEDVDRNNIPQRKRNMFAKLLNSKVPVGNKIGGEPSGSGAGKLLQLTQLPQQQQPLQPISGRRASEANKRRSNGKIALVMPDSPKKMKLNLENIRKHRDNSAPLPLWKEKFWKDHTGGIDEDFPQ